MCLSLWTVTFVTALDVTEGPDELALCGRNVICWDAWTMMMSWMQSAAWM